MCKYVRSLLCIVVIVLALFLSCSVFAATPNLLKNPSFEEADKGKLPIAWEINAQEKNGTIAFGVSDEKALSGKYSGKVQVKVIDPNAKANKLEAIYCQNVSVQDNKLYKLTFNYNRDNIKTVMPFIIFLDSDGERITSIDDASIYSCSTLETDLSWEVVANNGALRLSDNISKDLEWIERWIVVKPPKGTSEIAVWINAKGGTVDLSRSGSLYWDDLSMIQFVDTTL